MSTDTPAMAAIATERLRQQDAEGWTAEHDDGYTQGQLFTAAALYALDRTLTAPNMAANGAPEAWPWAADWWKPKDRRADLIRAGALCLAEQARLARANSKYTAHVEALLKRILNELDAILTGAA